MTADLERLRERLTELSDRRSAFDIGHYWNACEEAEQAITALLAEVEQLRAERERDRKDAKRYRWLRDHGIDGYPGNELVVYQGVTNDHSLLPEELDAAIDSAREGK